MSGSIQVLSSKGDEKLELPEDGVEAKAKVDGLLGKSYNIMATVTTGEGDTAKPDTYKVSGFDAATKEFICKTSGDDLRIPAATANVTAVAPVAGG